MKRRAALIPIIGLLSLPGLAAADDGASHKFYIGANFQQARLSVSDPSSVGGIPQDDYDSTFYDLRLGYRLLDAIGVEAHYGIAGDNGSDPGKVKTDNYYAFYVVPTGTLLDTVEISAPVGYASSKVKQGDLKATLAGVSYGLNIELPLRRLWSSSPDLRLSGGGTVYYHGTDARFYGFHYGLRWDFGL